ncbi:T9SS type B sorting domain-containing protein [Flavobacteriaceae bacterium TP-CH-4]|uniref:T9SS type B sorting domain-containing protein n=1 Tax=Pelagihabitans pacificus TaxID=2696054 RepID=A0A967AS97_9FLAO|nr:T9SS type B sorting domain-containing protein [Pelagihabitans pacificus]NHF59047.1 T9SS type B sorting domain-containing protein [Pelagihabitans pacificus]
MKPLSTKKLFLSGFLLLIAGCLTSFSQLKNDFDVRYEADIRGELTFIANNIVNRNVEESVRYRWVRRRGRWVLETTTVPAASPNEPYNDTGSSSISNDSHDMQYIDIDNDASTFSSSSATLDIPDEGCSLIRYAGLYWGAVYVNPDRSNLDEIKFRVPGGTYQDITADEILFDGNGDTDFGYYSPYACYKDVTSIVAANPNPDGDYFVANVRASLGGGIGGGISAGWTLVIVYENPNLPGSKFITTFDGYAGIKSGESTDIPISGFTTLPAPFDVNANITVAALEGDNRIEGDGLLISSGGNPFTPLNSTVNPSDNFFNANISIDPNIVMTRNPNSINTLGWDTDLFPVTNNFNQVIPNDATSAILRATSSQDKYDIFFAAFDVEIIAPNIVLEKKVFLPGGSSDADNITGQGVNLGQNLDYVLSFDNIGNDDATGTKPDHPDYQPGDSPFYTIRDVLPLNVSPPDGRTDFIPSDFVLPPGMAQPTYDPATRTLIFTIPDELVEKDAPQYSIRFSVQVAENCFDFINACSDQIENLAYSTYRGVENSALVTDDPSVTDFDSCGYVVPGATNFLLDDLSDCNFERTLELCGSSTLLDAGDGFGGYIWKLDANENGIFDDSDPLVPDDGDPDNDPSTILVNQVGTYIVDKLDLDPCKGFKEIIHVVPYGSGSIPNPIIDYFNMVNSDADTTNDLAGEIVQCSIDSDFLPKIFLCGLNDSRQLQVNIPDAQSISWELLDQASCDSEGDNCASKSVECVYNQVGTGNNFIVNTAGKYRLQVNYLNGCASRFFFHVFQNTLDIQSTKQDIICNTPGNITVNSPATGYGYRLVDDNTGAVIVPFGTNNSFDFGPGENGGYRVEVTPLDSSNQPITGACIFSTPVIGILDREVQYAVDTTDAGCNGLGSISLEVSNADANYEYEIRLDDGSNGGQGTLVDNATAKTTNYFTFDNLAAGDYIAIIRTDDGCSYSEQVTIADDGRLNLEARVSQHITCREGNIQMSSTGGQTPHTYAIWSHVDDGGATVISYSDVTDIPASEFQSSQIFDIVDPGEYTFVVVDRNSCFAFSNTVTIEFRPAAEFNPTSVSDVLCFGDSNGSIQMNLTDDNNYQLTYYLFDNATFDETNYNLNNAQAVNATGYFPGLPAGDYAIVINQRRGSASCDYFEYHTVSSPTSALAIDGVKIQDYTCTQDGIIEAQNVTGGTAPYEYSIDGIFFVSDTTPNAHRFENLGEGSYVITVRDAAGCTETTGPIQMNPLNEPTNLTFASTQPICPAVTSDVTVTVIGGNTPFNYEIIAPAGDALDNGNDPVFVGLAPGTYTFRVEDAKGCTIERNYTINPITPITVVGQLDNNISCFNLQDGAVTFNVADFATSYDYSVVGPANFNGVGETSATVSLTNLEDGTYSITVTDSDTQCIATASVTVAAPPAALVISDLNITDLSCSTSGTVPGSVTVTAQDGWGGYEYELEDPAGGVTGPQSNNSFSGLTDTSGDYTVTVRDAGGCTVTRTFTLTPTVTPVLEVTANSLCYDSTAGLTLTANVTSGGEAPFQYRLNGGAYQTEVDFTGLGPGSYTMEVIDSKNCTASTSIDVFPTLTASASLIKDLDCSASPDAEIRVTINGGNPTFTYEVLRDNASVQASTPVPAIPFTFTATVAGTYEFVITDSETCSVTTNEVVVTDNPLPTVTPVLTQPLCNSEANGSVDLNVTGGLPPYSIVFNGSAPSTQEVYAGLSAGVNYPYTVTDGKGCVASGSITLSEPSALAFATSITQQYTCDTGSATIEVTTLPTGGTGPYEYSIDGVNFSGSTTFSGLLNGPHTITVRDANFCTATSIQTIDPLNGPTDLSFSATAVSCPALSSDVTVSVVDGNAPFTYEIIAPAASTANNGNNNVFVGLAPGTYTFLVTDAKGCDIQRDYRVADITPVTVVSQLTTNVSCFNVLPPDGEFSFTVDDFATTYSYTVEDGSAAVIQSQNTINLTTPIAVAGLAADTYTVRVTDDTTNCTATTTMTISNPPAALDFTFTDTPVTCLENATITVMATDGWGSYEYQLENTVGPSMVYPYQPNNTFTNVPAGSYTIYVRDVGGCVVDKPITIDPAQTPTIGLDTTSDICYDSATQASLIINITDGVAPFSYTINGGGQTAVVGNPFTIPNLIPGTYDIQVTDAYGCMSNILSQTIAPQLTATATLTQDLLCTGNAIIDVVINGGTTPYATYQVQIDGGGYGATTAIAGTSFTYNGAAVAGTYQFLITDAQNCPIETNEVIITPTEIPQATPTVTDVACYNGSDGSVFIDVDSNFGTAPYTISFNGSAFTSTTNYSGLSAGNYPFIVRDNRGCEFNGNAMVNEPLQILSSMTARDVTCVPSSGGVNSGNQLGGVDVTITQGGVADYIYTLYDSANNIVVLGNGDPNPVTSSSTTHSFDGVDFGDYYVRIVDANGCESDLGSVRVRSNPYLTLTANIPPPDCPTGGTAEITASGGSGDYTFDIYDVGTPPTSEISTAPDTEVATFTGLNPGQTYIIRAYDNTNNCTSYQEVVIPTLSGITVTIDSTTDLTCAGADDGVMTFTVDNYDLGVTSIDYEILNAVTNTPVTGAGTYAGTIGPGPAGGPQSLTISQIPPGDYVLLVDEATAPSCSNTTTFRITEPTPVTLTLISQTAANCNDLAEVTVRASGGTGPYSYAYVVNGAGVPGAFPEGATFTLNPTVSLDWDIYAQDANNCIVSIPLDVTITQDPSPQISVALNDQCTADEGGFSVDITLDAVGIIPHRISIDGGAPQSASGLSVVGDIMTVTNLSSGAHTFEILDVNGCGETESITIYPPLAIVANITNDENCNPANTGEVTVTANGGSGNYTYRQIAPAGPTEPSGIFTGLTHSTSYTFEVEDVTTTCRIPITVTLPTPVVPTFTLSKTDVSCYTGSDGTITVTLDPGNIDMPYSYSLDGGAPQLSNVFNGLSQGTYDVTVISDKGCEDTRSIDVNEPSQLAITALPSDFSCDDVASTITVTIDNDGTGNPSGTGPYTYSFDGGANYQPGNTFEVPYGSADVTVVVKDANHCTDTRVVNIPVRQDVQATINRISAPIDCTTAQEVIEIVVTNGVGPYTYTELPSGAVVPDPTNIVLTAPGTYTYEVLDTDTNCSVIVEHVIAPYDLIDVSATVTSDATCSYGTDGQIEVTITGYTGTFDYEVLDSTGSVVVGTLDSDNATSDPYVFSVSTTLGAGTYSVRIIETSFPECRDISNTVTIDAPEAVMVMEVSNTPANCNDDAIVVVQASGGTAGYTYAVLPDGSPAPTLPAQFTEDETLHLNPSTNTLWDVYAMDVNGCISPVLDITISLDTSPDISLAIDDECAAEGSFGITVTLDAVNTGVAPYTMSIDGNAFENIASFPHTYAGLSAGGHSIEIRDANGCGETENINIDPELTVIAVVNTQPTCATNDGIIEFTVAGGSGAFTVELLRADLSATGIAATGNQFTGVAFGDFVVRVTDTTLGTPNCSADAPISLEEPSLVTLLQTDKTDVSCNGLSDGSITVNMETPSAGVNDNPPYTFEITDGTSTFTQNTNLFTGLSAGTWDITVTSNRNCVGVDQVTIVEPTILDAAITNVGPFVCDPNNTQQAATIEVTITAGTGTPDYFYSVNGGSFLPTGGEIFTYSAITAGNYDIVIRDANGCMFPLPTQNIAPLNTFMATVALSDAITCANGREEVLITVADNGNPNTYTYELLPMGNSNGTQTATTGNTATFELTAVGTYTFRITDTATGCYVDTAPYEIVPYDLIEVTAQAVDPVICYTDVNGSYSLTVSGYTGDYDYEVFDSADNLVLGPVRTDTGVNPRVLSGLSGGSYYVRVTEVDATGTQQCSDETNIFTIVSPDMPLSVTTTPLANVTCDNDRGELLIEPSGGYAPYDIVLTNTTTGDVYTENDVLSHVFNGLSAGNYTIVVTDNARTPGCQVTDNEVLIEPTQIDATAVATNTPLLCEGDTNATVSAIGVVNGSGNYEYQLNYYDPADANDPFNTSGAILTFSSGAQTSPNFNNLGAGIYSITVSDGWNCDRVTNLVAIEEYTPVVATLIRTSPMTCQTGIELRLSASGGAGAPYEYFNPLTGTWDAMDDAASNDVKILSFPNNPATDPDLYQFIVRDRNACISNPSNEISGREPEELQLEATAIAGIDCFGADTGVIQASAEGGLGNYRYSLFTDAALANNYYGAGVDQASGEFRDLPAGTYYVNVISEDCTTPPEEVIIDPAVYLEFTTTKTDVSCFDEEDGTISVLDNGGGTGEYQYAISGPNNNNLQQFDSINVFTGLEGSPEGTVYQIIAQDSNGCLTYFEETIYKPTELMLTATPTDESCLDSNDGSILLNITGGTAPYRAALNSTDDSDFVPVVDGYEFQDLAPGIYEIYLRDQNDCPSVAIATVAEGVNLRAEVRPVYECDSNRVMNYINITLEDDTILGDVMYALDSDDINDAQLSPDFRNSAPGEHYVTLFSGRCVSDPYPFTIEEFEELTLRLENNNINEITAIAEGGQQEYTFYFGDVNNGNDNTYYINRTDTYVVTVVDENGCEVSVSIFMEFIDIEIPNFFTPGDGDGLNDTWKPRNDEGFPEILTVIFDRYGREVYKMRLGDQGWDGRYRTKDLPSGDYWYILKLNGENDDREFVGHFTLYR